MRPIRSLLRIALVLLAALVAPASAHAKESKCPLPLAECMLQYSQLREHGWLGIEVDRDSTGVTTIVGVVPGGPADQAGARPGDVLLKVTGMDQKWIAGRAGWKDAKPVQLSVRRGSENVDVPVNCGVIPEDYLAHMIGVHVLEAHVAYMHPGDHDAEHEAH